MTSYSIYTCPVTRCILLSCLHLDKVSECYQDNHLLNKRRSGQGWENTEGERFCYKFKRQAIF